ncbi:hypothetical protein Sango_1922100 [Sesamum angolense]|uniref:Uncharacterized protein n=1 Tax=Sesamum angolense TaxID=2727404 RepID=A0AAE2BN64_9LAMI|nr:hypothetical protein Sango_1922100 [Sesamum angolense]
MENTPTKWVIHMIVEEPTDGDSSYANILFYKVYRQMELGNIPLNSMDISLYDFAGNMVHPLGQILLPLSLGTQPNRKIQIVHFLVIDKPSTYNVILGRPTLNAFQVVISNYHMKLKFPVGTGVREVISD